MLFGQLCQQNVNRKPVTMCKDHLQSKTRVEKQGITLLKVKQNNTKFRKKNNMNVIFLLNFFGEKRFSLFYVICFVDPFTLYYIISWICEAYVSGPPSQRICSFLL